MHAQTKRAEQPVDREGYYARIRPHHLSPLWEILKGLLPGEPQATAKPHAWSWSTLRPLLLEAGGIVTAEEAERRVLVLENPAYPGQPRATPTIYAGVQLVLPGETAPAHRHTPSAFRFILEGEGGYSAIGGERARMKPGDFVITPAWAFHDHGNDGDDPVMWLDGLDLPMARFFEIIKGEEHSESRFPVSRPDGDSLARYGSGLVPLQATRPYGLTSPVVRYPYERSREALTATAQAGPPDAHWGTTLRFANPLDGGWPMPTIATWLTFLPAGFETAPVRSTDGIVFAVAEGEVEAELGGTTLTLGRNDIGIMPNWTWRRLRARRDTVLFCFSDRAAQEKLGFWQEELR